MLVNDIYFKTDGLLMPITEIYNQLYGAQGGMVPKSDSISQK